MSTVVLKVILCFIKDKYITYIHKNNLKQGGNLRKRICVFTTNGLELTRIIFLGEACLMLLVFIGIYLWVKFIF
jgi:hypothetical protein